MSVEEGPIAPYDGQRYLGPEDRRVVTAGSSAHLLILFLRGYHASIRTRFHLSWCSVFRIYLVAIMGSGETYDAKLCAHKWMMEMTLCQSGFIWGSGEAD